MTSFQRKSITHLGTLHGEGTLLGQEGRQLGQVTYEIDGYVDTEPSRRMGKSRPTLASWIRAFAQNTRASF
jgi:hypothetical protein